MTDKDLPYHKKSDGENNSDLEEQSIATTTDSKQVELINSQ